jgi:hypothetical protein
MTRRRRLAVTVTLALHLLAPVGAYAAARPATDSSDYCSSALRAGVGSSDGAVAPQRAARTDSGVPAPRSGHSPHSHCPSCLGTFVAAAIPPSATPFFVAPRSLDRVHTGAPRTDIAAQPALLPPLRGPPSVLS